MKTNLKLVWKTAIVALFTAAIIGGCRKDDYKEVVGVCPLVVSTDPANGASGVRLDKIITATFNEQMDPATITQASFSVQNGAAKAGVVTYTDKEFLNSENETRKSFDSQGATSVAGAITYNDKTASFAPSAPLTPNTTYTGIITTEVKDLMGNTLQTDYVWTFSTGLAPTVISTDPVNNATGIALNKIVTATFSIPMDPLTVTTSTFTLKNGAASVAGTVSYLGTTASFTPSANLVSGTTYTATITTGANSSLGIPLANNYVWNFTTLLPPSIPLLSASNFGAFGGNAGVTNQGLNTVINNGGIGTTAASTLITGFHDALTGDIYTETPLNVGNVTGGIFTAPPFPGTATSFAIASQALLDAIDAYNFISPASMPGGIDPNAGELGGLTLAPGIYKSASGTFNISNGPLTLDAQGDANAVWVFQTASSLTVGIAGPLGARSVIMINGGQPKNVFWYVGSAATINGAGGGVMVGTIIANSGVTFSTAGNAVQTVLNGRAISLVASVTMVNTTINVPLP